MNYRNALIHPEDLLRQENKLFDVWLNQVEGFIPDGCANPYKYCCAPVKLLFVLKEVNGGKNWDLRTFMKNGARKRTWNVVARWTENIFNLNNNYLWHDFLDGNDDRRNRMLSQICAINLKKTPGKFVANSNEIKDAVVYNKAFLKKQLELYKPDIIILCGTEEFYKILIENQPQWKMTSRGIWYYIDKNDTIVIDYLHPEARTKACLLHYGLIDAIREIKNTN